MKLRILACALAMLLPSVTQARSSQWWFVAQAADRILFVDVPSIERDGDQVRYQASQILREPGNPVALIRAYMITDCRKRTEIWDMALRFGADDERLDKTGLSYPDPDPIADGSLERRNCDLSAQPIPARPTASPWRSTSWPLPKR